jgi:hypothetical protein
MSDQPANPPANALPPGVTESLVADAVRASGYPLQTKVAALLSKQYHTVEEWAYRDDNTDKVRTLDVLATSSFGDHAGNEFRVRPRLILLIECKQSDLPYVFFLHRGSLPAAVPALTGLHSDSLTITTDDDASTWELPIFDALGLGEHPFLTGPPTAASLSKCVRKGKGLELSGDEGYQSLILPLVTARDFHSSITLPPPTYYYFDVGVTLCVGVVDAPMIGASISDTGHELRLLPWVRVVRHLPSPTHDAGRRQSGSFVPIDVVHAEFLEEYLVGHAVPFFETFAELCKKHAEELATGKAFAPGMGADSWTGIERRIRPRTWSTPPPLRIPPVKDRLVTWLTRIRCVWWQTRRTVVSLARSAPASRRRPRPPA